jgi:hypothetical protein
VSAQARQVLLPAALALIDAAENGNFQGLSFSPCPVWSIRETGLLNGVSRRTTAALTYAAAAH